ncbi:MAG: RNA-binding domain-containing protein [Candidatus Omnitrophota bacterium]
MKFKESETVELKKSTSELKEAIISIGAILNKHGKGTIYFGIEDDGRVVGQQVGRATVKDISRSIANHIAPKIFPDITVQKISGKDCLVVDFSGHEGLYSAFGRFYLRSGEEDTRLTIPEIGRLVEKKRNYVYSWGSEVSGAPIGQANVTTLRTFIKRGKEAGRINFSFDAAKNVLNKLHLVKGSMLLNAGRALFCKDNGVEVQAAVFAGKDKITFLDIQSFHGNLFELIEKSESYVKEHINWRADLSGSKRIEIPEIPVRAIKEAIINSLCHRDFTNPKSNEIAIYRDRIEIFNPGPFPYEYSPEDFVKGDLASIPRNPLIAETLYLSEDIEKWGSGLRRISEECKAAGVKMGFRKSGLGFVVIFSRPELGYSPDKGSQKRLVEGLVEGLVENQKKIIKLIHGSATISKKELSNKIGISTTAIDKNISQLKKKGLLRRLGPDKGGHWEITK